MKNLTKLLTLVAVSLATAALGPTTLADEDDAAPPEKVRRWSVKADFKVVLTSGNSESTTLGLGGTAQRKMERSLLELRLGALKVDTVSDLGVAIGTGF